jgi:hypothetical protein
MQQTLFALGALMITMLIALNQQRSVFQVQQMSYLRELENAAGDFGARRLEEIMNTVGFDETVVGAAEMSFEVDDLTGVAQLGHDASEIATNKATFDDLDDYDGFSESATHVISADTFQFHIRYSVSYVSTASPDGAAGSPTFAKEITATIESDTMIGDKGARVVMKRVAVVTDSF